MTTPAAPVLAHTRLLCFSFAWLALLAAPLPAQAQDCDRGCLEGFADQLLAAYATRDASALPLAEDFRYTENGQDIALDDGLWRTFVSLGDYRLHVSDPEAGQVVFMGTVEENDAQLVAHFRLKIENREIAEIEALLTRGSNMAVLENLRQPKPIFLETLPPAQRRGREEMIAITDSYFTGLDTENSGANVPFHPDCARQENGMLLANNPDPEAGAMQRLGCKAQFDTGFSTIVSDVRERRFVAVDEERGLSYAIVFFDHDGTAQTMGSADGTQHQPAAAFRRPSTIMIGELFKIVDGQIRQIEAIIVSVPYGMPSGWSEGERNAPTQGRVPSSAATTAPPAGSAVVPCDRGCLEGFVDQYLAALVANDPAGAPFAADAKFTENAQVLELGDALWGTASGGPGDYKLVVSDPETRSAGFWVLMEEADEPIWLTGRLTVDGREITELETVIIRSNAGLGGFDLDAPDPLWTQSVPPERRASRSELFAAADGYLDTLQDNLVDHVAFSEDCNRIENGVYTANSPTATSGLGASSCRDNVNSGMWVYITEIHPRRHLIADEERGIAMGVYMFHHNGQHDHAMVNGERVAYSGATRRPFTTVIPEMFKVQDGRIQRIWATMVSIPYRSDSGWE